MKTKILTAYPGSVFGTTDAPTLYIADFSKRTNKARGVEIHIVQPKVPDDGAVNMDCCVVTNGTRLSVEYNVFKDNQFKNEENQDVKHGECCLFPSVNNDKTWILFIEIKDCKESRISKYKKDVKDKIILNVNEFRKHGIITNNNVYGVVAFPRKKRLLMK